LTEAYRVPKHKVSVELTMSGRLPTRANLFLSELAESHSGVERPSDLLNGEDTFFPVLDPEGSMVLLHRDAVMVLSVPFDAEFAEDDPRTTALKAEEAVSVNVLVVLEDGTSQEGTVTYLMPDGQRRLQDFLNLPERFVTLRQEGRALLIHKGRVNRIMAV
jgi:hypothetical protein